MYHTNASHSLQDKVGWVKGNRVYVNPSDFPNNFSVNLKLLEKKKSYFILFNKIIKKKQANYLLESSLSNINLDHNQE